MKLAPLVLVFLGVAFRLLPHPPNFAPITAIALFSAYTLPKKYAFSVPILSLLISDYFIGFYGYTMLYVYSSFILVGLIGLRLRKSLNIKNLFLASLAASLIFFVITNLGVWLSPHSWYSRDLSGLINCYVLAIPFFRNTLAGDVFFTFTIFGLYLLALSLGKRLLPERILKKVF